MSIWQVLANIADVNYPLGFIYVSFIERLSIFVQTVIVLIADDKNGTVDQAVQTTLTIILFLGAGFNLVKKLCLGMYAT